MDQKTFRMLLESIYHLPGRLVGVIMLPVVIAFCSALYGIFALAKTIAYALLDFVQ